MRLLILGPPGAGKGTQAALIADQHEIPAISTGDIFRENIRSQTPLGLQVKDILAAGGYVTDEITNAIVRDRLNEPDAAGGFLLDGYPRTLGQVEALDEMLSDVGERLDAVIELVAPGELVVGRLMERAKEQGRVDDTEEVIRERMAIYEEETAPLVKTYTARGLLHSVDGLGSVDEVNQRIEAALVQAGDHAGAGSS